MCASEMARSDFPDGKCCFFPAMVTLVGGRGGLFLWLSAVLMYGCPPQTPTPTCCRLVPPPHGTTTSPATTRRVPRPPMALGRSLTFRTPRPQTAPPCPMYTAHPCLPPRAAGHAMSWGRCSGNGAFGPLPQQRHFASTWPSRLQPLIIARQTAPACGHLTQSRGGGGGGRGTVHRVCAPHIAGVGGCPGEAMSLTPFVPERAPACDRTPSPSRRNGMGRAWVAPPPPPQNGYGRACACHASHTCGRANTRRTQSVYRSA